MKIVIITSIVVLLWCVIYKTCHSRKDTPLASGSTVVEHPYMEGSAFKAQTCASIMSCSQPSSYLSFPSDVL